MHEVVCLLHLVRFSLTAFQCFSPGFGALGKDTCSDPLRGPHSEAQLSSGSHCSYVPIYRGLCPLATGLGVGGRGSFPRGCLLLTLPHPFLRLCSFPALQKHCCGFPSGRCRVSYGLVLGDCGHLTNINQNEKDWGTHGERQNHS